MDDFLACQGAEERDQPPAYFPSLPRPRSEHFQLNLQIEDGNALCAQIISASNNKSVPNPDSPCCNEDREQRQQFAFH